MIITTAIMKGGTGKTTTAAALAQAAAFAGRDVLCIDMDPQANLTHFIGASEGSGAVELLHGKNPEKIIIRTPQKIDIVPAAADLATEKTAKGSANRLKTVLQSLRSVYDYIIIDTPPTWGDLTYNALKAAETVIIPLECDNNSIQGLYNIMDALKRLGDATAYTIITRYDGRANLNRFYREQIENISNENGARFLGTVRPGIAIKEAQAFKRSLYDYAPRSNPAADYMNIFTEIDDNR